jgi:hypothetical protein
VNSPYRDSRNLTVLTEDDDSSDELDVLYLLSGTEGTRTVAVSDAGVDDTPVPPPPLTQQNLEAVVRNWQAPILTIDPDGMSRVSSVPAWTESTVVSEARQGSPGPDGDAIVLANTLGRYYLPVHKRPPLAFTR